MGKPGVHQGKPDGVLRGVKDLIELVEFAKYLQRSREKNNRNPGVSSLHPANGADRCADPRGKVLLRELPAAASQGDAFPKSGKAA